VRQPGLVDSRLYASYWSWCRFWLPEGTQGTRTRCRRGRSSRVTRQWPSRPARVPRHADPRLRRRLAAHWSGTTI